MPEPKRLITHSEDFHTDDVFATALLLDIFPDAQVIRTRDEAVIASGDIVYDVGKQYDPAQNRFDHHQAGAGQRGNGIIYSAFGLLWQEFGVQFCLGDTAVAAKIDKQLVMPIDAHDNGQTISQSLFNDIVPFTIDNIIGQLNPRQWTEQPEDYDSQFNQAVQLAQQILRRLREVVTDDLKSQTEVINTYTNTADKRILVFDKMLKLGDALLQCPDLIYTVSPRPDGNWGILAVPQTPHSFQPRRPFPEAWRGQPAADLPSLTGVTTASFCHANGFYAATKTKADAIALAQKSLATTDT